MIFLDLYLYYTIPWIYYAVLVIYIFNSNKIILPLVKWLPKRTQKIFYARSRDILHHYS